MWTEVARSAETSALPLSRRLAEAGAAAGIVSAIYMGVGRAPLDLQAPVALAIDGAIPFVPASVWFYMPGYWACFLLAVWVLADARAFRAALAAFVLMTVLAAPFFVLWPVYGPRPAPPLDDGATAAFVRWLYANDPAVNTFPSLHVANATFAAAVVTRYHRRLGVLAWTLAFGVFASVLLLKQHYFVDLPGGWALAAIGVATWRAQTAAPTLLGRVDALLGALRGGEAPTPAPARFSATRRSGSLSRGPGGRSRGAPPPRSRRVAPASPDDAEGTPRSRPPDRTARPGPTPPRARP